MSAPLKGVRVLELARILAGPWIGQTLADLGAEVIKVESPAGDDTRRWGPPFIENADGSKDAAYFHACNRGKRSVIADFSKQEDLEHVRRLAASADVVLENFKVGGLVKFGLDYANLKALNPSLIYCSVTGFGQDGPYAHRAGYDFIIQAMSGAMDLTGEPEGTPQKAGVAYADIFTGLYGVIAVQAALLRKAQTGQGEWIDMALMDAQVGVLANQAMNYLATGNSPQRMGNAHPNIVPYQVFQLADGHMVIAVGNDSQFTKLCDILGEGQWAQDERFASNAARVANRAALIPMLEDKLRQWRRGDLFAQLERAGVPAGPINSVAEALEDPQIIHRTMRLKNDPAEKDGAPEYLRTPITYREHPLDYMRTAPILGGGGDTLLSGVSWQDS
ncbi:CaiB/BaiF CoA transferase family protein [Polycladidibacter hongkongensis]|uniref:CaiB/BaiF CoA transferase family protein n=1 Tax=Polycladidibacter hongkongensis TaxID=1647556 RepID=UPI00082A7FD7|nr:CaiB/BaiF CoA-transferase family protein [Pseudovibrio hongkongensis]